MRIHKKGTKKCFLFFFVFFFCHNQVRVTMPTLCQMADSPNRSYNVTVLLIGFHYHGKGGLFSVLDFSMCIASRPSLSAWMGPAGNSASPWRRNTECGNPQSQHCFALSSVFIYSFYKLGLFWGNVELRGRVRIKTYLLGNSMFKQTKH